MNDTHTSTERSLTLLALDIEEAMGDEERLAPWIFRVQEMMPRAGITLAALCGYHLASHNTGPDWPGADVFEISDLVLRAGGGNVAAMRDRVERLEKRWHEERRRHPEYVERARWSSVLLAQLIADEKEDRFLSVMQDACESVVQAGQMTEPEFRRRWWRDVLQGIHVRANLSLSTPNAEQGPAAP